MNWYGLLTLIFLSGNALAFSATVFNDPQGMPRCVESPRPILIYWQQASDSLPRKIYGISLDDYQKFNTRPALQGGTPTINSCADWAHALPWPLGLRPIKNFARKIPPSLIPALKQISEGGTIYHPETTAEEFYKNHSDLYEFSQAAQLGSLKNSYGPRFANQLINYWLQHQIKNGDINPQQCERLIGTCEFYLCEEAKYHCGSEGYLVNFAHHYCTKSLNGLFQKMETQEGRSWTISTVQCLQEKMQVQNSRIEGASRNCELIQKKAMASHPDCYVQSGFCELPLRDKLHIFTTVKKEALKKTFLPQVIQTLNRCDHHHE